VTQTIRLAPAPVPSPQPIFILGISPRSGTNYLSDLIRVHPDCVAARLHEDYFTAAGGHLVRFASEVLSRMRPEWGVEAELVDRLCAALGGGLVNLINAQTPGRRVVLKTPSTEYIELFFRLFPSARLLILVRDGRAVVESHRRSFGGDFDALALQWAQSAERILRFDRQFRSGGAPYRIVRYEDLVLRTRAEVGSLLDFLGLDPAPYDFAKAENLPVRGSSSFSREADPWSPRQKTKQFNPLERAKDWDERLRARFDQIAGAAMEAMGYARS
jgi:hypothetical protein